MKRFLPLLLLFLLLPGLAWGQSNGTLSGSPSFASSSSFSTSSNAANFGSAISLNGTSQSVLLPSGIGKHLNADNWFVSVRFLTTQSSGLHVLVSNDETQSGGRVWWIGNNAGQLQASIGSNTTNIVPTSGVATCNDGTWHEAGLAVSSNVGYLFFDGTLVGSLTVASSISGSGNTPAIGYYARTSAVFGGQIDEVAYYSTALHTASYTIPTSPFGNTTSGLTNLYHLDGDASDSYVSSTHPTPAVSPTSATVIAGAARTFTATVTNDVSSAGVSWSLTEGTTAGTLSSQTTSGCTYTAGSTLGTFHLVATSIANSSYSATAVITVSASVSYQVVCDGNSLTYGNDASSQTTTSYPPVLGVLLGSAWTVVNHGVSGITTPEMTTAASGSGGVDSLYSTGTYASGQILVAWEITNDLYWGASHSSPASAATAYADYVTYCTARRAAGWKVVAVTVLPRANSGTPTGFEAARLTCNTSIRAHWRLYADALADIAGDSRLGLYGDQANATYYYISGGADSQVHLVDLGYSIVAQYVASACLEIAAPSLPAATGKAGLTSRALHKGRD